MKITKKKLQNIIEKELEAVLEQAAFIKHGMQVIPDSSRQDKDASLQAFLRKSTKDSLAKHVKRVQKRLKTAKLMNQNDRSIITMKKQLQTIKSSFPLELVDGTVASYEELMTPMAAGYTGEEGYTGDAAQPTGD